MAEFCVALRMTPAEYKQLTMREYAALAKAYSKFQGNQEIF
jgi:hypothetical protein